MGSLSKMGQKLRNRDSSKDWLEWKVPFYVVYNCLLLPKVNYNCLLLLQLFRTMYSYEHPFTDIDSQTDKEQDRHNWTISPLSKLINNLQDVSK